MEIVLNNGFYEMMYDEVMIVEGGINWDLVGGTIATGGGAYIGLPCGYKPCLGALASFVGMVGGALCIQGMVEGVVGWFGESTFLEQLQLSVDTKFVSDIMLAKVLEIKESTWQQLQGVVDAVKSIPVGLRFLLGLAAVIGCGFCEHYCADGNSLF